MIQLAPHAPPEGLREKGIAGPLPDGCGSIGHRVAIQSRARKQAVRTVRNLRGLQGRWIVPIALVCLAFNLHAEIIDRIAVSVGNQAITTSDVERETRVTAFLNRTEPDFSPAARRATADRMVEQHLILRELENSRYPAPAATEIDPILDKFKKDNFAGDEEYNHALAEAGITDRQVRDELLWQRRLLLFLDVRFRPSVQVTGQDIEDYFSKVVEPAARAAHPGQPVTLEEYRDRIEEKLTGEQVDKQMSAWLASARQRTEIVFHPEAFQ
jgi:hypothetical protein